MAAPDLTAARRNAGALLVDRCTLSVDAEGSHDEVLDLDTLTLRSPDPDLEVIYDGACLVRRLGTSDPAVLAGQALTPRRYRIRLPHDAELPADTDQKVLATITASENDPALVGRVLEVRDVVMTSLVVTRQLICEERT